MDAIKIFNTKKIELKKEFNNLECKLKELSIYGIDVNKGLDKIKDIYQTIDNEKILVVLLGAFSDGKTTIAASLLGEIWNDMKIDENESSDEIIIYNSNKNTSISIVDTPGLFGHKTLDVNGKKEYYDQKTRDYLSKADLILYISAAKNPIKQSHIDTLKYIMDDLNKQDNMVFIINKMDSITDLYDPEEYEDDSSIKREFLISNMIEGGISVDVANNLEIKCVAADPFGKGLDYWLNNPKAYNEYKDISNMDSIHILLVDLFNNLEANLKLKIKSNVDSFNSIINDVKDNIESFLKCITEEQSDLQKSNELLNSKFKDCLNELKKIKEDCKYEINEYFRNLHHEIEGLDNSNIDSFIRVELGRTNDDVGFIFSDKISSIMNKHFERMNNSIKSLNVTVEDEFSNQDTIFSSISKKSVNYIKFLPGSKMASWVSKGIFGARDLLSKYTSVVIKFKPWQVAKIAKFSQYLGPIVSTIAEIIGAIFTAQQQEKLRETKKELSNAISNVHKELLNVLNSDNFEDKYFPQLKELEEAYKSSKSNLDDLDNILKGVKEAKSKLNTINL